jgi:hypothetical protein
MSRATFEGPVLAGDNRFGALRDVGTVRLTQSAAMNVLNTTVNTVQYGGSSGQFVVSNDLPNGNGVVYTPSSTTYPPVAATITADGANAIYRGWVAYIPTGSRITAADIDVGVLPTVAAGNLTNFTVTVGNAFNGAQYATTGNITAVGRQTTTFSASQLANCQATTADITNSQQPATLSQVVFTANVAGNTMTSLTAGLMYITLSYTQADGQLGSTTVYPYGNLD